MVTRRRTCKLFKLFITFNLKVISFHLIIEPCTFRTVSDARQPSRNKRAHDRPWAVLVDPLELNGWTNDEIFLSLTTLACSLSHFVPIPEIYIYIIYTNTHIYKCYLTPRENSRIGRTHSGCRLHQPHLMNKHTEKLNRLVNKLFHTKKVKVTTKIFRLFGRVRTSRANWYDSYVQTPEARNAYDMPFFLLLTTDRGKVNVYIKWNRSEPDFKSSLRWRHSSSLRVREKNVSAIVEDTILRHRVPMWFLPARNAYSMWAPWCTTKWMCFWHIWVEMKYFIFNQGGGAGLTIRCQSVARYLQCTLYVQWMLLPLATSAREIK